MFPLNTILAWSINIIMNKKYDNNNIIIASRAYFLQYSVETSARSVDQTDGGTVRQVLDDDTQIRTHGIVCR
jgi:hypothetical protein